jgi:hypothetical protein
MALSSPQRILLLITALSLILSLQTTSADISAQQIFDAVDTNHDHSITQFELEGALSRFIDGAAAAPGGGAPPLGLDSNRGNRVMVVVTMRNLIIRKRPRIF